MPIYVKWLQLPVVRFENASLQTIFKNLKTLYLSNDPLLITALKNQFNSISFTNIPNTIIALDDIAFQLDVRGEPYELTNLVHHFIGLIDPDSAAYRLLWALKTQC